MPAAQTPARPHPTPQRIYYRIQFMAYNPSNRKSFRRNARVYCCKTVEVISPAQGASYGPCSHFYQYTTSIIKFITCDPSPVLLQYCIITNTQQKELLYISPKGGSRSTAQDYNHNNGSNIVRIKSV